jgi:hypothetical protein
MSFSATVVAAKRQVNFVRLPAADRMVKHALKRAFPRKLDTGFPQKCDH